MQRDSKLTVFMAVFISLAALMIILSFAVETSVKPGASKVYLVEDSYRPVVDHGYFVFSFVIENHENRDTTFGIEYLLGDTVIGSETIATPANTTAEYARQIQSRFKEPLLPVKFTIRMRSETDKAYELSYWVKGLDYS